MPQAATGLLLQPHLLLQLLPALVLMLQGVASACQQQQEQSMVGPELGLVLCPPVLLLLAMVDSRPCLLWLQSSCSSKPRN